MSPEKKKQRRCDLLTTIALFLGLVFTCRLWPLLLLMMLGVFTYAIWALVENERQRAVFSSQETSVSSSSPGRQIYRVSTPPVVVLHFTRNAVASWTQAASGSPNRICSVPDRSMTAVRSEIRIGFTHSLSRYCFLMFSRWMIVCRCSAVSRPFVSWRSVMSSFRWFARA